MVPVNLRPIEKAYQLGNRFGLVPLVLPGGLGRHKWVDRRALEGEPGPWSPTCDPLLVEPDGELLETGRANVFVVTGDGESDLELTDDGRIRLVEHYEMHGKPQLSVCEEIVAS